MNKPTPEHIPYKGGLIVVSFVGNEHVSKVVQYHVLDEGPMTASSVQAAKKAITTRLREHPGLPVLSIDAWRDSEGGWDWNNSFRTDLLFPAELVGASTRKVLNWMRGPDGPLAEGSKGKVTVEEDESHIIVYNRLNNEPLFAVDLSDLRS